MGKWISRFLINYEQIIIANSWAYKFLDDINYGNIKNANALIIVSDNLTKNINNPFFKPAVVTKIT